MHKFVSYKFIDSKGNLRDKVIRIVENTRLKLSGPPTTWFDGSSIGFTKTNKSDLILEPDTSSEHFDPIRNMQSYFCFLKSIQDEYQTFDYRYIASSAMNVDFETKSAKFGVEPEFFICKESPRTGRLIPIDIDDEVELVSEEQYKWYGCLPPTDKFQDLRLEIAAKLEIAGIFVESMHHEVAPGQCELSWKCNTLLKTCDQMMLFKYIVSNICYNHGLVAVFEAKPFKNLNGNGCHVHQSIPAMKDEKIVEVYAQGLVDHYDELLEVCCTGKSSHDRLIPGFEAPTRENNGWGWADRTKTVRIPGCGGRLEYRLGDPDMNPYLALPKMLKFGYEAVKNYLREV